MEFIHYDHSLVTFGMDELINLGNGIAVSHCTVAEVPLTSYELEGFGLECS